MITMKDGTRIKVDLQGQIFGKLTILEYAGRDKHGEAQWLCQCQCERGNETVVRGSDLRRGKTNSCGCFNRERASETHQTLIGSHTGARSHPLYTTWRHLNDRVLNSGSDAYNNYGGRGITICQRWRRDMPNGFKNFCEDVESVLGPKPAGHTIDRVDNSLGYGPANVRWSSAREQSRNTRRNIWVVYRSERMVLPAFAERVGIKRNTLGERIRSHPECIEYNANGDIVVNNYLYPTDNVVPFRRAA